MIVPEGLRRHCGVSGFSLYAWFLMPNDVRLPLQDHEESEPPEDR